MIGFTSTTFRLYDVDKVINIAKNANIKAIEWGGDVHVKNIETAKYVRDKCAKQGLIINSYASYYRIGSDKTEDFKNICEIASAMGANSIRTWLGVKGSLKTTDEEYQVILSDAQNISYIANEYGLIISNECHPNTYNDTMDSALKFLRDVNRNNVKTYFQSWYHNEKDDMRWLYSIKPYLKDVHISYSEMRKYQFFHKKDKFYIDKLVNELKQMDFKGVLFLEYVKGSSEFHFQKDIEKLSLIFPKY